MYNSTESNVKALFDKLIGNVDELRKRVKSLEDEKQTGMMLFLFANDSRNGEYGANVP